MQPVLLPPVNDGTVLGQLPVVGQVTQSAPLAQLLSDNSAQAIAHKMTQTGTGQIEHQVARGHYANMHQRFHQGDLAKSIQQERPMDTMPMTDTPSKASRVSRAILPADQVTTPIMQNKAPETHITRHETDDVGKKVQGDESEQEVTPSIETTDNVAKPGKKEKPSKAIKVEREGTPGGNALKQGPRCAKCVKSHKRCTHRVQQSPTPQQGSDVSFGVVSAVEAHVPASDAPEGHTPAPRPVPDLSLATHAPMPTPLTSEKTAATKRKRQPDHEL